MCQQCCPRNPLRGSTPGPAEGGRTTHPKPQYFSSYNAFQEFFNEMYVETGIALENIVYYKNETHYFVMSTKKLSLLAKGALKKVRSLRLLFASFLFCYIFIVFSLLFFLFPSSLFSTFPLNPRISTHTHRVIDIICPHSSSFPFHFQTSCAYMKSSTEVVNKCVESVQRSSLRFTLPPPLSMTETYVSLPKRPFELS